MSNPLLTTKFHVPPGRPDVVQRPHLIALLDETLQGPCRLILVSAPAGFGKTTLVAEWISHVNRPATWLSLDKDDNEPAHFWRYVIAALQTVVPALGQMMMAALDSPQLPPLDPLLTTLLNDLAQAPQPLLLVLDDYHVIENKSIHDSLNFLLDRLPAQLRLVLTTRVDPPLALSRRRANAQLAEIRAAELRFSPDESAIFLNTTNHLDLSDEDIRLLEHRTEGWIVGLQLAALSLRQRTDRHAFVKSFAGDDRYVVDYLLEEVLQRQPPAIQRFLLHTSILERLCGPLCEAVTGDAHAGSVLHALEQANLFIVPLDNQRYWYRYHHLFADLLLRRLSQVETDRLDLYRRACEWYEREGFLAEAISQALSGSEYELAADLLDRHVLTLFFHSETMMVHHWLQALPEAVLSAHPLLCAAYANTVCHAASFQPQAIKQAEAWLQTAERGHTSTPVRPGQDMTRSFIALTRAYLALWRHDDPTTVIELAQRALDTLPPEDELTVDPNYLRLRSGLTNNLGVSYLALGNESAANQAFARAQVIGAACGDLLNAFTAVDSQCLLLRRHGRLHDAADLCRDALESLGKTGQQPEPTIPYAGRVYICLGQILLEWNDLDGAEQALVKGVALTQLAAIFPSQFYGCVSLAHLRQTRGDSAAALQTLRELESLHMVIPERTDIDLERARLALMQGDIDTAATWAAHRQHSGRKRDLPILARVAIVRHHDLSALLDSLTAQIDRVDCPVELAIELWMLRALALQTIGDMDSAVTALERSLELAEPGGYMRLFLDEGEPLRALLHCIRARKTHVSAYASRLLTAWDAETAPSSPQDQPLIEPLSPRELEVLRLLASGTSNAEIAQALVITVNTAKKHVVNILGKLDVTSRAKAVTRARELGLIE